ncbi:MAG: AGE family epimerase/isomerase [Actinomycetaceae bacterium]|nr:AGE family epimerase/isomerase [Actinomycetaceae bacterium]MDU0969866.1 AGE family epimerase/isomerase [Actinomycetaceae bacterium]
MPTAQWRHDQRDALMSFATNAVMPAGFGYLDAEGHHQPNHGIELWINGRFTHVFACEVARGNAQARPYLDLGMKALTTSLRDPVYDGWFASVKTGTDPADLDAEGHAAPFTEADTIKQSYSHAFVILAAASALQVGHPAAQPLLDDALALFERYWWEPQYGRVCESYPRDWSTSEAYRGINANMHTTECLLACYDATGERKYLERALGILRFTMSGAAENNYRIREHYTADWQFDNDYNRDRPADPFRPWGATVGHGFEWARLALQAGIVAHRAGVIDLEDEKDLLVMTPLRLIAQAEADGWHADGADGFVYTTDFEGQPITHERMHWVVCEAVNAAHVARLALAELADAGMTFPEGVPDAPLALEGKEEAWWQYAQRYLIAAPGRWLEELDRENHLSERTWTGMPEIYHAYQSLVLPDGDYAVGFAKAAKAQA